MDFKDYYAALGVAPDSDQKAIKQACTGSSRASTTPTSSPATRRPRSASRRSTRPIRRSPIPSAARSMTQLRNQYQQWSERGGRGDFDWSRWQAAPAEPGRGTRSYNVSPEDMEDLFGGGDPFSDFFGSIFGQAGGGPAGAGRAPRPRQARPGSGSRDHPRGGVPRDHPRPSNRRPADRRRTSRRELARAPGCAFRDKARPESPVRARETSISSSRSLLTPRSRAKATICARTCASISTPRPSGMKCASKQSMAR